MSELKKKILAVDDTPENLQLIVAILRERYAVAVATSADRALHAIKTSRPNLILLDVVMPQMDGYELCRILKADSELSDIPVVFVTSKNDFFDDSIGYAVGGVAFLAKPLEPKALKAVVETYIG